MKKLFTNVVTKSGEIKEVSVLVDDQTATILEQVTDEERNRYLRDEYKMALRNRTETRRHISLTEKVENNQAFYSEKENPLEIMIKEINLKKLENGFEKLTVKQKEVIELYFYDGKSFHEIAEILHKNVKTVFENYEAAIKKLKKFFQ